MTEIGGYFEQDPGGVSLNSSRNALRHIVRQLMIKSIWVPEYTYLVVWDALKAENCELKFYSVGLDMLPTEKLPRKFFGVADGGIAFGVEGAAYELDDSSSRLAVWEGRYGDCYGGHHVERMTDRHSVN